MKHTRPRQPVTSNDAATNGPLTAVSPADSPNQRCGLWSSGTPSVLMAVSIPFFGLRARGAGLLGDRGQACPGDEAGRGGEPGRVQACLAMIAIASLGLTAGISASRSAAGRTAASVQRPAAGPGRLAATASDAARFTIRHFV
jgi:hypothetical protein